MKNVEGDNQAIMQPRSVRRRRYTILIILSALLGIIPGSFPDAAQAANIRLPASVVVASGNNQHASIGRGFGTPLRVWVRDAKRKALAGVMVRFETRPSASTVVLRDTSAVTDGDGYAQVTATAGTVAGKVAVTARVNTLSASFTLTVTPGAPAALRLISGGGQTPPPSEGLDPITVSIVDAHGNVVTSIKGSVTCTVSDTALASFAKGKASATAALKFGETACPTITTSKTSGAFTVTVQFGAFSLAVPVGAWPCPTLPNVRNAGQLRIALANANSSTMIVLGPGKYSAPDFNNFDASAKGTQTNPILLCGPANAVLSGYQGTQKGHPVLHLVGTSHWTISGITVTNGLKGIMVDESNHIVMDRVTVYGIGDEAIHLRSNTTDSVVKNSTVHTTGLHDPELGEGIYVGSAHTNWGHYSQGKPDQSDRNVIDGNTISQTMAEAIDVKEGTSGGTVRGNFIQASGNLTEDSTVDIKGNGWQISNNRLSCNEAGCPSHLSDGFAVLDVYTGWGNGNIFSGNYSSGIQAPGWGIKIPVKHGELQTNVVRCDNALTGFHQGISNINCVP